MLLTIIIPVFNTEKYIQRIIECILRQPFQEWEMILVDDGSTDDSAEIIKGFEDDRIRYVYQKNAGPSAARNKGLELAQGDYISFLDADDWFEEGLYTDYFKGEGKYDIVFQGFVREYDDGRVERSFAMDADNRGCDNHDDKFKDIVCKLYKEKVFGWSWCKIFRREIIEKYHIRFDESLRLWEDELFTIQFLTHAKTIKTIACRNYHYIYYGNSLMSSLSKPLTRLHLTEIMNDNLPPIANDELLAYINDTYNKELKFSMLMALMNKKYYNCDEQEKRRLLKTYYSRCKLYPSLIWHNSLKNRISYIIAESILMTHSDTLIIKLFSKL